MRPNHIRLRTAIAATAAVTAVVTAATAAPAGAYNLTTLTAASTGKQCSPAKFSNASVKVVLHLGESQASTAVQDDITDAVTYINSEIGLVGGSQAYISSTTTTTDAFTFRNWFGDTTPTIHVGFDNSLGGDIGGETGYGPFVLSSCTYEEVQIALPDVLSRSWDFGYPGWDYFQATETGTGSALWFRPVYLHELLHAFGVAHTSTEYAQMNYGIKP